MYAMANPYTALIAKVEIDRREETKRLAIELNQIEFAHYSQPLLLTSGRLEPNLVVIGDRIYESLSF